MADTRVYNAPGLDMEHLAETMQNWLRNQGFETQAFPTPGGLTVQARKTGFWQQGVAITTQVMQNGDNVQAQVGTGKWAVHAVEGVAAAILFWPLLAIPAYNAYKLKSIIDETLTFIDRYVAAGGDVQVPSFGAPVAAAPMGAPLAAKAPAAASIACPQCGKAVKAEAKFCDNCGAKLQLECAQCGAVLRADAKFCDNCGAKVVSQV
jgi:RNA polymerase subunit RPABC4/transcription elongation factor Spt4